MAPFTIEPPADDHDSSKLDFVDSHVEFHAVVARLADNRVPSRCSRRPVRSSPITSS